MLCLTKCIGLNRHISPKGKRLAIYYTGFLEKCKWQNVKKPEKNTPFPEKNAFSAFLRDNPGIFGNNIRRNRDKSIPGCGGAFFQQKGLFREIPFVTAPLHGK